jgi:hypothetical protein
MKKIMFLISILLFLNCGTFLKPYNYVYTWDSQLHFGTLESINKYVCFEIKYDENKAIDQKKYWQTPKETYEKGTGICTDKSILFMYWAKDAGFDSQLILFQGYDKEQTENLGRWSHAVVKCIGKYWDPTNNEIYKNIEDYPKKGFQKITKEYSYSDTMYLAETFHGD